MRLKVELNSIFICLFIFHTAHAQLTGLTCIDPNECDARANATCRPIGGCERFCDPKEICRIPLNNCYCRSGYARNALGRCVPRRECPRECMDRECPNHHPSCSCEMYCFRRSRNCLVEPSGCHCARGYARDLRDTCVPLTLCPRPTRRTGPPRFPITTTAPPR